uniref:Uncharacterized protein n=1 Tax=Panagrolaimus sp. JU765 TaxID=591449 RepID=A0AC34QRQ2_9BILA
MAAKIVNSRKSTDSNGSGDGSQLFQYKFIFLGSHHKASLFEKLCESVDKYEQHVQYPDIWYLYLTVDGTECIIELNDPGLTHTGAREMAIRKADAIILCYSAISVASFHQLSSIAEDFRLRKGFKHPPVRIICNEDDVVEEDIETASVAEQSSSEGYESEDGSKIMKKRPSMEKILEAHEQNRITTEQGETMAKLFGPDCEFHSFPVSQFTESRKMLEDIIRIVNEKNPAKVKQIKKERRKSKERSSSVHSAKISPTNSIKSEPSSASDTAAISRRSSIVKKLIKQIKKERRKSKERSSSVHSAKISPTNSIKSEPSSASDTAAISHRSSIVKKLSLKKGNSTVCTIS